MSTQQQKRTFEATATRRTWDGFVSRVKAVVDECIVTVDEDGVATHTNNSDKSAGVKAHLGPGAFESFSSHEPLEMGVELATFAQVIGLADVDDPVRLVWDSEDYKFHVQGPNFEYTLAGIGPGEMRNPMEFPDGEGLSVSVDTEPTRLKRALEGVGVAYGMYGQNIVTMEWTAEDDFRVSASGDTDSVAFEWPEDDLSRVEHPTNPVGGMYSPGLLDAILTALSGDTVATFEWGEEYPMFIEQDYADGHGAAEYVVAPRIQTH